MFRKSLAGALTLAALTIFAVTAQSDTAPVGTVGWFHATCDFSHRASVDPIVFPGQPDTSHSHDFFGSITLDENSTNASIRAGGTSCLRDDEEKDAGLPRSDRSAYWEPTVLVDGQPVTSTRMTAAYTVGPRDFAQIQPFPADLRVIAGDSSGVSSYRAGFATIYKWRCGGQTVTPWTGGDNAPTCATPDLRLDVNFPDCWDGQHLDSPNHKSHMAYSQPVGVRNVCPQSHPVLVPALMLRTAYATTGGPGLQLVKGSGAGRTVGGVKTTHADFMNGWLPGKQEQLVADCLNVDRYCGGTSAPVEGH